MHASCRPDAEQGQEKSTTQMFLESSKTPLFADCVLISNSGDKFYTYKGMLWQNSRVFKDILENCDKPASSPAAEHGPFELQLPDASEAISAALAHIHDSPGFWKTIKNCYLDEFLRVLRNLVTFAHKYDFRGTCERVDEVLCETVNLNNLISSGLLFNVWELVDNYHLERSQQALQALLSRDPALFINNCDAGIPASCDYMRSALTLGQAYASAWRKEMTDLVRDTKSELGKCMDRTYDLDEMLRDCFCTCGRRMSMTIELGLLDSVNHRLRELERRLLK